MTISITTKNDTNAFEPGAEVCGVVSWSLSKEPKRVTVSLMWRTEGKGTQDTEVADSMDFEVYNKVGEEKFSFTLPIAPYSCSGQLISICWALEAFIKSGNDECRYDLIIAPNAEEVSL